MKANKTVLKETKFIAVFVFVLSVLMNAVFLVLKRWDYTVLLGNILSATLSVYNFFFMGMSVQEALSTGDEQSAKKVMRASQGLRTAVMFLIIAIGVAAPCFNTVAVILPVFFPRIAILFRTFKKDKESKDVNEA